MLALPLLWIAGLSSAGCIVIHGDEVTARDLGISLPAFRVAQDPDLVLAPAPKPGMRKAIGPALLSEWLDRCFPANLDSPKSANGLGPLPSSTRTPSLCLERERTVLTREIVEQSLRETLLTGRDIVLIIEKFSPDALPAGHPSFPTSGAAKPSPIHPDAPFLWRGSWLSEHGPSIPIWASVRAYRFSPEVRLKTSLPAGSELTEGQLETEMAVHSAFDERSDEAPQRYVGKLLKRFCASGSVLNDRVTESVPVIRKDSEVLIEVVSGDLRLKLTAKAEEDGWSGQTIPFVTPTGHRKFRARVQPSGSAILAVGTTSGADRQSSASSNPAERQAIRKGVNETQEP